MNILDIMRSDRVLKDRVGRHPDGPWYELKMDGTFFGKALDGKIISGLTLNRADFMVDTWQFEPKAKEKEKKIDPSLRERLNTAFNIFMGTMVDLLEQQAEK